MGNNMYNDLITHYTRQFELRIERAKTARSILQSTPKSAATERIASLVDSNSGSLVVRRGSMEWHYATPLAGHSDRFRIGDAIPAPDHLPDSFTVCAADGSQIFPDSRDRYPLAMIRVASYTVTYGSMQRPRVNQTMVWPDDPELLDILTTDQPLAEVRAQIGGLRDRLELRAVAEAAAAAGTFGDRLAMVDGPLHLFNPVDEDTVRSHASAIAGVQATAFPVGVISGGDARYTVRLAGLLANIDSDSDWSSINDWDVWGHLLPGERSPLFGIASGYNAAEGSVPIAFFYLNVGDIGGIMRVEVPQVITPEDLYRVTGMVLAESLHLGYPFSLIKAHQLAVIRGAERAAYVGQFDAALAAAGLYDRNRSTKELLKAEV